MNLILSAVSSGVMGSPTLSPWKKSFPGGPRPNHVNHLFDGCVTSMVVLVVWWWSHPTCYGGTWVQIPLRANFLSNIYSKNMIIWGAHCQGFSPMLSLSLSLPLSSSRYNYIYTIHIYRWKLHFHPDKPLLWCGVLYKSRQPAKFAGFAARFRQLLSLLHESKYVEEMDPQPSTFHKTPAT